MKSTRALHDLGQSLWLDNITRELLNSGTLERYIGELSVTGLTSNPTIFDHAIKNSATYDEEISLELLVPAEKAQLEQLKGDKKAYDRELRPRLMVRAIQELQKAGVEPDIWKVEGLDRREDCERIVATARAGDRDRVACIILGRGEDERKVRDWLTTAASVPGFVGFAVGRTVFWEPLVDFRAGKKTRETASSEIARHYRELIDVFETVRRSTITQVEH